MAACGFFHTGDVAEEAILDCYRLAKYYGVDPDTMLQKPTSRIRWHMMWTTKLIDQQRAEEDT
jgi:hypothetical protein